MIKESLLNDLCTELQIPKYTVVDLAYLKEYCKVMKPFAEILDFLQGEQNIYYGMLIPSLVTLKVKTDKLISEHLTFLQQVIITLQENLLKRFQQFFNLTEEGYDAIVASISHPNVILTWLKAIGYISNTTKEDIENIFIDYCKKYKLYTPKSVDTTSTSNITSVFDFGDDIIEGTCRFKLRVQLYISF